MRRLQSHSSTLWSHYEPLSSSVTINFPRSASAIINLPCSASDNIILPCSASTITLPRSASAITLQPLGLCHHQLSHLGIRYQLTSARPQPPSAFLPRPPPSAYSHLASATIKFPALASAISLQPLGLSHHQLLLINIRHQLTAACPPLPSTSPHRHPLSAYPNQPPPP